MKTVKFALASTLGLFLVASPQTAAAQSGNGWWDWALMQVVQTQSADRTDECTRRGGTLSDIIRCRAEEAARDRQDGDDDRDDRDDRDGERTSQGGTLGDIIFGRDGGDRNERGRAERGRKDRGDKGPPFCRNGQGHPVHGMQWCRDKGFGTGGGILSQTRWEERGWDDIILGAPRDRERRSQTVGSGGLLDVLGEVVFGRIDGERRRLGGQEALSGRWLAPDGRARVLQIRSGSVPVAELTDANGDGRVDLVLVPRR